ncbi:hypothetical protein [Maribacter sp. MAR_2009_72]|uniref:hypothetical protein n=1 Tax=Maribacter sp. MAR_2009_72 TaxID=1250050 RepID=UPI00119A46C7|nr:hypothetical protein [Maribacter sp. MAR_2009_72]TVZ16287.1 hypothetical protein JM81_2545 [Maribacter sp. MAR_2009_72]
MKENNDKLLEKLVDKMMKDSPVESPSFDFTANVMSKVFKTKTNEAYLYKPLIPKSVFFIIFVSVILLFMYAFINGEASTDSWANHLNFTKAYSKLSISFLSVSKETTYIIFAAILMFLVQITFLKKYFDNKKMF